MTPEACVLRSVLDLLAAKRILAFRNNVGVMRGAHKGKNYFVKFGTVGMADVIAYPKMNPQNISGCQICDYFPGSFGSKQRPSAGNRRRNRKVFSTSWKQTATAI
jgi:hypothetical protein